MPTNRIKSDSERPHTIVSLMGKSVDEILSNARAMKTLPCDFIEWRADHLSALDCATLTTLATTLRATLPQALIFTIRTSAEGGELTITKEEYAALNQAAIASGAFAYIDLQLFFDEILVQSLIDDAHQKGVQVIVSNHDFKATPTEGEIVRRLMAMHALAADVAKIAVMPQTPRDVLTLLSATLTMHEHFPSLPLITIAMGRLGVISRIGGQTFGSCATFAAGEEASAPGQVSLASLREILKAINNQRSEGR